MSTEIFTRQKSRKVYTCRAMGVTVKTGTPFTYADLEDSDMNNKDLAAQYRRKLKNNAN